MVGTKGHSGIYLRTKKTRKIMSINMKKRFSNPQNHPNWNTHLSKKTKKKISKSHVGMKASKETKIKMKKRMIKEWKNINSIFNSKESRKKRGLATQKRWKNIKYKNKMSNNLKKRWTNLKWKKMVSKKISKANKGKIPWTKGKHLSKKHKKNIGLGNLGKKRSKKTRRKIRNIQKGKSYEKKYGIEKAKQIKEKMSEDRTGKKHPYWKGGNSSGYIHKLAKEKLKQECIICKFKKFKECLEVHHKDWNHKNNKINNLVMVCRNCHFRIHHSL